MKRQFFAATATLTLALATQAQSLPESQSTLMLVASFYSEVALVANARIAVETAS